LTTDERREKEFWVLVKRALMMIVRAVEKYKL